MCISVSKDVHRVYNFYRCNHVSNIPLAICGLEMHLLGATHQSAPTADYLQNNSPIKPFKTSFLYIWKLKFSPETNLLPMHVYTQSLQWNTQSMRG